MSGTLAQLEGLKRQLSIQVSSEELSNAYAKHLAEISKTANIKGFRPGKVPMDVLEQKFAKSLLQEAAVELIQKSFDEQVKQQTLKLAGLPSIDFDPTALKKGEGFEYKATFETYPEVALKDLSGVAIERAEGEISDSDVENMLIKMRTQHAEWHAVDRAAKLGDRLTIDFDGMMDGKPLDRGSAKDAKLELGSNSMIPGFEDGLIGAKKGETRVVKISFPAEYHVENLRSKPVEFTITVHSIEEPKLPALDDAFAKKMGVDAGIDELKQKIKERMEAEIKEAAHQALKTAVFDKLMGLNIIEAPSALIDAEIQNLQHMMRQRMRSFNPNMTEAQMNAMPMAREMFVDEAKKRVILGLLLAEVIKASGITVDQERVKKQIEKMAANHPDSAEVISMYNKNDRLRSEIEAYILEEQAVEALLTKATVATVKKNYDALIHKQ